MSKPTTSQRILIFTAEAGGGHVSLAQALADTIKKHDPKINLKIVNTIPKPAELLYRYIGNRFAHLYTNLWEWTNNVQNTKMLMQLATTLSHDTIRDAINKYVPTLVMSTEPFALGAIQQVLKEENRAVPSLVYVADPYTIHQAWATKPYPTAYLSSTPTATQELIKMGVPKKKIATVGFLVRKAYYSLPSVSDTQKKSILFVGGSGSGGGEILKLIKCLTSEKNIREETSLIIACGKDTILKSQLKLLPQLQAIDHEIVGYTPHIHKYLGKCDMVIGKPGPNLLFESIMYRKPFIATSEPLAQEVGNYEFIDQAHIGYSTTSPRITLEKVKILLKDKGQFKESIEKVRKLHVTARENVWQELKKYL